MMKKRAVVRLMRATDIAAVLDIQSCCYDQTKLESHHAFLAKQQASPGTCFIALTNEVAAGYLVAIPVKAGSPPPLNSPDYAVPRNADALYLHDLAIHPAARGTHVAAALLEAYFQALRQLKLRFATLTAVNASAPFWERYGFRPARPDGMSQKHMATYGWDAQYMSCQPGGHLV